MAKQQGTQLVGGLALAALLAIGAGCSNVDEVPRDAGAAQGASPDAGSTPSSGESGDASDAADGEESAHTANPGLIVPGEISRLSSDFRMGMIRPGTIDPARAVPTEPGQMALADLLFDGLTRINPGQAEPQPALAESFVVSDDGLVWTFTLRSDATFSDGRPITASDAEASIERIVHQGLSNWSGLGLQSMVGYNSAAFGDDRSADVAGVRALGDRQLEINLREPFAPLATLLAMPQFGIVPADGIDKLATGASPTSGSLRVAQIGENGLVLRPADDTAGALGVAVEFFDDRESAFEDYLAGALDWSVVPVGQWSTVPAGDRGENISNTAWFYVLGDRGPLADKKFRTAVAAAIDVDAIVEAELGEAAQPLSSLVLDSVLGYETAACRTACSSDPGAARALLEELFPEGDIPAIELDVLDNERDQRVAAAIVAQLAAVDIPAEIRTHNPDSLADAVVNGDLSMFRYGWVGGSTSPDSYLAPLADRTSIDSTIGLEQHITPGSLDKARSERDPAARAAVYRAIEQELLDEVVVIPFAQFRSRVAVSQRVDGFVANADGTFDIVKISLGG